MTDRSEQPENLDPEQPAAKRIAVEVVEDTGEIKQLLLPAGMSAATAQHVLDMYGRGELEYVPYENQQPDADLDI